MRYALALALLAIAAGGGWLCAQESAPAEETVLSIDRAHAQEWSSDIDGGWLAHEGDNPAWSRSDFDDSGWEQVRLDSLGAAQPGWHWYRLHIKLNEGHPDLTLLIEGGVGVYELYVNGVQVPGPRLLPLYAINRPTERVFPLDVRGALVDIAIRTYAPYSYAQWRLPLFMTVSLGTEGAIESQRRTLESDRLYALIPAVAINLLLLIAGVGAFLLHRSQPDHAEYLWLGAYLFLVGAADLLWYCQAGGYLSIAANMLVADPLLYPVTIAQIEFTFSFGGRRPGRVWRIYEGVLLIAPAMGWLCFFGKLPSVAVVTVESILLVPVALFLPLMLLLWYRNGNREAGWLILPSLLPAATMSLYDLGTLSIFLGWKKLEFLVNSIPLGPVALEPNDLGNLLFLLAITIVIFFRFTRVSREQARAAAELNAAREIQRRLVPSSLPEIKGFAIEAAYIPAQEVGGDFYLVLGRRDGGVLVVVGDVSGKGLSAAMTGASAIGALRTLSADDPEPAALITSLNAQIWETNDSGFITCICARVERDGAVTVANAGHLSPYLNGVEVAVESGLPLGVTSAHEYEETHLRLEPGDVLTLLSDGVVEARNAEGQLYGFERTRAISSQSAASIASTAKAFGQSDDITVLTLTRRSAGEAATEMIGDPILSPS